MINTYKIYEELKEDIPESAARKIASLIGSVHDELQHLVITREELRELKDAVKELILAHKSAEQRITKLEITVSELTEAQKKSEERLTKLEITVSELAEAHKKAEERLTRLEVTVQELIEAQKKTEQRLNELAEAQKKTEQRLNELAEAQKKTEEELRTLIGEHKKTREQLGGLSHTVGYILEDRAYKGLPELLKRDFGVQTISLKRDFIEIATKKYEEINIFGEAQKNGKKIFIIGDCKTQLKKRDIDDFLGFVKKIDRFIPSLSS